MKTKLIFLLAVAIFAVACSNDDKKTTDNQSDVKTEKLSENSLEFQNNFEQKTLPYTIDENDYGVFSGFFKLKRVQPKFLYIFNIDTTENMTKDEKGWHYTTDYFYKAYIKTDKIFDLIILGEYPYPPPEGSLDYYMYTYSPKKDKIIDRILIGRFDMYEGEYWKTTTSTIDKQLNINVVIADTTYHYNIETDILDSLTIKEIIKKYKITPNGFFIIEDSISTKETISNNSANKVLGNFANDNYIKKFADKYNSDNPSANDLKYILDNETKLLDYINSKYLYNLSKGEEISANDEIKKVLPFVHIDQGPEGCCFQAYYSYYALYEKSKETPENDDNIFFDTYAKINTLKNYDGEYFFADWDLYTEDVDMETSYSKLGNRNFYNALLNIQNALNKNSSFNDNIKKLFYKIFYKISDYKQFSYSKEKVIDELNKIGNDIIFEDEQASVFNNYVESVTQLSDKNFNLTKEN